MRHRNIVITSSNWRKRVHTKVHCSTVSSSTIISISQGPRDRIVSTTKGIEANARGLLITDEYGRTTRPGIFASGDVVAGARTVVEAVEHSKKVAQAMDDYMQGRETAENAD